MRIGFFFFARAHAYLIAEGVFFVIGTDHRRAKSEEQSLPKLKKTFKVKAKPETMMLEASFTKYKDSIKEQRRKALEDREKKEDDKAAKKQKHAETTLRMEELRAENLKKAERIQVADREFELKNRERQAFVRWVQMQYPQQLAHNLIQAYAKLPPEVKTLRKDRLRDLAKKNWFQYLPAFPEVNIMSPGANGLVRYTMINNYDKGGAKRAVKCSAQFMQYVDEIYVQRFAENKNAEVALRTLFTLIYPESPNCFFTGTRSFHWFLHVNDYLLDKAFIHCVWSLSKGLRKEEWPEGLYEFPPKPPLGLTRHSPAAAVAGQLVASSSAASSSAAGHA